MNTLGRETTRICEDEYKFGVHLIPNNPCNCERRWRSKKKNNEKGERFEYMRHKVLYGKMFLRNWFVVMNDKQQQQRLGESLHPSLRRKKKKKRRKFAHLFF